MHSCSRGWLVRCGVLRRNERGITSLETAIVFIGHAIVSSIFTLAVLTTGLISAV